MPARKPIVIVNGQLQQLQVGDQIDAAVAGTLQQNITNNDGGSVVFCTPVYIDATNSFKRAQANATATSWVIGLVAQTSIANATQGAVALSGPLTATTAQWDAVTLQVGGLTPGVMYYLDAVAAGRLTSTPPPATGNVVAPIGKAVSTTTLNIEIKSTILL